MPSPDRRSRSPARRRDHVLDRGGVRDGLPRGVGASYRFLCGALVEAYREIGVPAELTRTLEGGAERRCLLSARNRRRPVARRDEALRKRAGLERRKLPPAWVVRHLARCGSRGAGVPAWRGGRDRPRPSTDTITAALGRRPTADELESSGLRGMARGLAARFEQGTLGEAELVGSRVTLPIRSTLGTHVEVEPTVSAYPFCRVDRLEVEAAGLLSSGTMARVGRQVRSSMGCGGGTVSDKGAADDALLNLRERSVEELRELLDDLYEEEQKVSYRRRVLHGKIDILRAELVRRLKEDRDAGKGVVSGSDIERLIEILANDLHGVSRYDVTADDEDRTTDRSPRASPPARKEARVPSVARQDPRALLNDLATDAVEERVVEYVIREVHNGRRLTEALTDPYVKNRLSEERLAKVLENPEVVTALEEQIAQSFKSHDFGLLS